MKSVPQTMRGPVDDNNFSWMKSRPRLYESKGEAGLRTLRRPSPRLSTTSSFHHRGHTTGSIPPASAHFRSRDDDGATTILPKIATGRSAHSAKKLWKDVETIKIRSVIQKELETPQIPPLFVPKNPKPLYKRPVDQLKHFNTLHLREFAERGELEPQELMDCSREFYAQITFLRNAVRNVDGTTSYQNLCKKPRSWSEPSPTDNQPGLIKGNRLHWQSASTAMKHPRMLLPLKPGPSTKWYAWRVSQLNNGNKNKDDRDLSKNKLKFHEGVHQGDFLETFSPRPAPHPTPAAIKMHVKAVDGVTKPAHWKQPSESQVALPAGMKNSEDQLKNTTVEPNGITFITEHGEMNVEESANQYEQVTGSEHVNAVDQNEQPAQEKAETGNVDVNERSENIEVHEEEKEKDGKQGEEISKDKVKEHEQGEAENGSREEEEGQSADKMGQSEQHRESGEADSAEVGQNDTDGGQVEQVNIQKDTERDRATEEKEELATRAEDAPQNDVNDADDVVKHEDGDKEDKDQEQSPVEATSNDAAVSEQLKDSAEEPTGNVKETFSEQDEGKAEDVGGDEDES